LSSRSPPCGSPALPVAVETNRTSYPVQSGSLSAAYFTAAHSLVVDAHDRLYTGCVSRGGGFFAAAIFATDRFELSLRIRVQQLPLARLWNVYPALGNAVLFHRARLPDSSVTRGHRPYLGNRHP